MWLSDKRQRFVASECSRDAPRIPTLGALSRSDQQASAAKSPPTKGKEYLKTDVKGSFRHRFRRESWRTNASSPLLHDSVLTSEANPPRREDVVVGRDSPSASTHARASVVDEKTSFLSGAFHKSSPPVVLLALLASILINFLPSLSSRRRFRLMNDDFNFDSCAKYVRSSTSEPSRFTPYSCRPFKAWHFAFNPLK